MTDNKPQSDALESKLGGLFGAMREQDSRRAPPFPLEPGARDTSVPSAAFHPAPRKMVGALAAAVIVAIVATPMSQSPDEIYLHVMNENMLMTDELMLASPSVLPELDDYSELYDTDYADELDYFEQL